MQFFTPSNFKQIALLALTMGGISNSLSADDYDIERNVKNVVVVANVTSRDSLELANFYIKQRGIPQKNLVVVQTTTHETIERNVYVDEILNPLREQLLEKGFLEGNLNKEVKDFHGRFSYVPYQINFKYLVLCKGVPLRIKNQLVPEPDAPPNIQKIFRTTNASVDSDLALLPKGNTYLTGWIQNSLFQKILLSKTSYNQAISVCRIDGPSYEDSKRIITDSIIAESQPYLFGRSYIDLHPNHADGNRWLKAAARSLENYGYDVDIEPGRNLWSETNRHDAPAIYFGWYSGNPVGPHLSSTDIPKGSIGAHIHSFSAATVNSPTSHWVGPLIHAGYSVTFGNVYEPYLQLTLRPDLFIEHLLNGYCVGDASLYAQPVLSWQNVTIADPLYRPFSVIEAYPADHGLFFSNSYAKLISINRIQSQDKDRAIDEAFKAFIGSQNIPLALKILTNYRKQVGSELQSHLFDYFASLQMIPLSQLPALFQQYELLQKSTNSNTKSNIKSLEKLFDRLYESWPEVHQKKYQTLNPNYLPKIALPK